MVDSCYLDQIDLQKKRFIFLLEYYFDGALSSVHTRA